VKKEPISAKPSPTHAVVQPWHWRWRQSYEIFRNLAECHKTLSQKRDIYGGLQIPQGT
jgi:hypothetical protein